MTEKEGNKCTRERAFNVKIILDTYLQPHLYIKESIRMSCKIRIAFIE